LYKFNIELQHRPILNQPPADWIYDTDRLAEAAGLKVVMNRCPKIELFRPFWKPRLDLPI